MHDAERREAQAAYQAQRRASVQQRSHDVERFVAAMNAAGNPGALLLPEPEPRTRRFTSMRFDRRPGWAVAERSLDAVFRAAPALVSTTGLVYADTEEGGFWLSPGDYLLQFTETPLHRVGNLVRVLLDHGLGAGLLESSS